MRTVGRFLGGPRVDVEPIDLAPQVVRHQMTVGFGRDPGIAVTEDSLHGAWVHALLAGKTTTAMMAAREMR